MLPSELVLIALNTVSGLGFTITLVEWFYSNTYRGIMAVIFCVLFLLQGIYVEKRISAERYTRDFLYLVAFGFSMMILPFQLGAAWLSFGWLAQGLVFTAFGKRNQQKRFTYAGYLIHFCSMLVFLSRDAATVDFSGQLLSWSTFLSDPFLWRYAAQSIGLLVILLLLRDYSKESGIKWGGFQALLGVNLIWQWLFSSYLLERLYTILGSATGRSYFLALLLATYTLILGQLIWKQRWYSTVVTELFGAYCNIVGFVISVYLAFISVVDLAGQLGASSEYTMLTWVLLGVHALFHGLIFYCLREALLHYKEYYHPGFFLPILCFFLLIISGNALLVQFKLSIRSLWLSLTFITFGLAWIILGFRKRNAILRRTGLGLALLTVVKVFLLDLNVLFDPNTQVASYFAFGLTLLGISYIYHHFSRILETPRIILSDAIAVPQEDDSKEVP